MTAEERYDLECQIDALYNEADYCDDHNDPAGAVAARATAAKLRQKLETEEPAEDFSNVDPFDVDWNISKDSYTEEVEPITEDALITEEKVNEAVCKFVVRFNKNDDAQEFDAEDAAYNYAKEHIADEPHIFKVCGEAEPVEVSNYQDFNYGLVDEELLSDAKELDEASSAFKNAAKEGGEKLDDLITGMAIAKIQDPKAQEAAVAALKAGRPEVAKQFIGDRKLNQAAAKYEDEAEKYEKAIGGMEEDYTGSPEERTDHLEYVDDNPTDDKFKLPKNITKEEDDHCEKVNPVINHDPDDKDILKESLSIKATEDDVEGCHISLSGSDFGSMDSDCWVSYAIAKEGIDADLEVYLTGPTVDELDEWFDIDIDGDWSHFDDRDVGGTNDWTFDPTNVNAIMYFPRIEDSHGIFKHEFYNRDASENITAKEMAETLEISEEQLTNITNRCDEMAVSEFENVAADYVEDNVYDYLPDYDEEYWD